MYRIGLGLFLMVILLPVAALVYAATAVAFGVDGTVDWSMAVPTTRQLGLLLNSILLAGGVTLATVALGALAGTALWQWRSPPGVWLRWLVLPLIVVPPYVHAEAWISAAGFFNGALKRVSLHLPPLSGWFGAAWVETMAYLPLAAGLALLGLASVEPRLVEAARVQRGDRFGFFRVVLPLALPQILAGGGVVFALSLADYSIPSLFQLNVYPLELFVLYSQEGTPAVSLLFALPLVAVAAAAIYLALGGLRAAAMKPLFGAELLGPAFCWPRWLAGLQRGALGLLGVQILLPLASLLQRTGSWERLVASTAAAQSEWTTSLAVAGLAGLCCLPLGTAAAARLASPARGWSLWWLLLVLPLALPAPLIGIGLVKAWNNELLGSAYGTLAMPVLAALARFTPFAALVLLAHYSRLDPLLFDAASLFQRSRIRALLQVRLPILLPGLLAAGCIVGALSLGELGATLIVAPPARATLTMRIYNYMHYGSSASVAGLCLVMLAATLLLGAVSAWGFYWWFSTNRRQAGEPR